MEVRGVNIQFLGHSGFLITCTNGKRIAIDPYNISDGIEKADLILITHSHYDHCSIKDISKLVKEGTIVIMPPDVQSKITKIDGVEMQLVEVGDKFEFGKVKIEAFPSYNINKDFHPKKEGWLGYLVKIDDVIIYHAGDSDKIPEMKNLSGYGKRENEFVMLLPISGEFVMNVDEAYEIASLVSPDLVIPMHYGAGVVGTREDAERFIELCKESGLRAEILEKI